MRPFKVRKHLLGSIIAKYAKVKPKVDSNLAGPGKPTKKELERWKIRRAKKLQRRHDVVLCRCTIPIPYTTVTLICSINTQEEPQEGGEHQEEAALGLEAMRPLRRRPLPAQLRRARRPHEPHGPPDLPEDGGSSSVLLG